MPQLDFVEASTSCEFTFIHCEGFGALQRRLHSCAATPEGLKDEHADTPLLAPNSQNLV